MMESDTATVDIVYDRDLITVYRAVDTRLCQQVINLFNLDASQSPGRVGDPHSTELRSEIKLSQDLEIRNAGPWGHVLHHLHEQIHVCIQHYLSRSPVLSSFPLQATGYKIQRYPKQQGYFHWHADSVGSTGQNRVVAMVLYLNHVSQGGETEFFHQGIRIAPKAGLLALFPATWSYMHRGQVPQSDDKYIISSFIKIKD